MGVGIYYVNPGENVFPHKKEDVRENPEKCG